MHRSRGVGVGGLGENHAEKLNLLNLHSENTENTPQTPLPAHAIFFPRIMLCKMTACIEIESITD